MYNIRFDSKEAMKVLQNLVNYSDGFIKETKAQESTVTKRLARTSIEAFYDYLDGLARTNPSMLHHVYEWGAVGDPGARLVELKRQIASGNNVSIDADFLTSSSVPEGGNEPFYDKAEIMEEGVPVTIDNTEATALFFQIDNQEFFRMGPIVIQNPGGEATRGSFVATFEEFYNDYFEQVYLRAIRFYDHFRNPKGFSSGFSKSAKSGNAFGAGKATALSWIMRMPGEDV